MKGGTKEYEEGVEHLRGSHLICANEGPKANRVPRSRLVHERPVSAHGVEVMRPDRDHHPLATQVVAQLLLRTDTSHRAIYECFCEYNHYWHCIT